MQHPHTPRDHRLVATALRAAVHSTQPVPPHRELPKISAMREGTSYPDHGTYMDTNVDEGQYEYVDVVPKRGNHYEGIQPPSKKTTSNLKKNKVESKPEGTQVASSSPDKQKTCCNQAVCRWLAVLIGVFIIAAALVGLLVFFLTSSGSDSMESSTVNMTITKITAADGTTAIPTTTTPTMTTPMPEPKNCQDILESGDTISRVYNIYPNGRTRVKVFCEQQLFGGGWAVFQRRYDGSTDFYQRWYSYRRGFGVPAREYWVGNDNLRLMTVNQDQKLKVELRYGSQTMYADYSEFWIENEDNLYKLHVAGYSGGSPPGDGLGRHSGEAFTTKDMDNDGSPSNCASSRSGGWWYHSCDTCNLNGVYGNNSLRGITWDTWKGSRTSLSAVRMMIKTK